MSKGVPKEKRRVVVLVSDPPGKYVEAAGKDAVQPEFKNSVVAIRWIKKNGETLSGKKLVIASMTKPMELKVKQKISSNFDLE